MTPQEKSKILKDFAGSLESEPLPADVAQIISDNMDELHEEILSDKEKSKIIFKEKSKVIFEALGLGPCWHEADKWHCKKCGVNLHDVYRDTGELDGHPNYFDPKLPDDERVKLITAAFHKYGWGAVADAYNDLNSIGDLLGAFIVDAPTIAEAIFRLITEGKDGS